MDFSVSAEFTQAIDLLYELGILIPEKTVLNSEEKPNLLNHKFKNLKNENISKGEKKYTFTKKEITLLKHKLDNYEKDMQNQNQQSILLVQPMLQLIKQLVDIMFEAMKDENKLIDDALSRIV